MKWKIYYDGKRRTPLNSIERTKLEDHRRRWHQVSWKFDTYNPEVNPDVKSLTVFNGVHMVPIERDMHPIEREVDKLLMALTELQRLFPDVQLDIRDTQKRIRYDVRRQTFVLGRPGDADAFRHRPIKHREIASETPVDESTRMDAVILPELLDDDYDDSGAKRVSQKWSDAGDDFDNKSMGNRGSSRGWQQADGDEDEGNRRSRWSQATDESDSSLSSRPTSTRGWQQAADDSSAQENQLSRKPMRWQDMLEGESQDSLSTAQSQKQGWQQAIDEDASQGRPTRWSSAAEGMDEQSLSDHEGQRRGWQQATEERPQLRFITPEGWTFTALEEEGQWWLNVHGPIKNPTNIAGEFRAVMVMRDSQGDILLVDRKLLNSTLQAGEQGVLSGSRSLPRRLWTELSQVEVVIEFRLEGQVPLGVFSVKHRQ